VPTLSAEVVSVATPALTAPVPIEVAPSKKVTVPVGVPVVVMVAVKVIEVPALAGLLLLATLVVLVKRVSGGPPTWLTQRNGNGVHNIK
jgi:hypothetical protein